MGEENGYHGTTLQNPQLDFVIVPTRDEDIIAWPSSRCVVNKREERKQFEKSVVRRELSSENNPRRVDQKCNQLLRYSDARFLRRTHQLQKNLTLEESSL
jgi:N12 class adenine-specific DNA methylase